jgi:hypothetical protein
MKQTCSKFCFFHGRNFLIGKEEFGKEEEEFTLKTNNKSTEGEAQEEEFTFEN